MRTIWASCVLAAFLSPATTFAESKLDRVVLGYSAAWRDSAAPVTEYDYDGLTFLCRSFLTPMPDGTVGIPEGFFTPELTTLAHQHGVKLLMSIGGGGAKSEDWMTMATHPQVEQKFLDALGKLMTQQHYDGFDVDWEPADPQKADEDAYGGFLKAMRARFPQAVITTALDADAYQTRFTPWPDVLASVNFVNAMAYDYCGPWGGIAGHGTGLFPAGDYDSLAGHDVDDGMQNLIKTQHVPPEKLLMGMNLWGYRYRVNKIGDHFPKNAPNVSDALSYQQIQNLMTTGHYQELWDERAMMPYLQRIGGGSVVCFENPESIRRKCEYAKHIGCAGVMIWNVGSDICQTQAPLMDAITQSSGGQRHPLSRAAVEAEIVDTAAAIQRDGNAHPMPGMTATAIPADLKSLTDDQLESLNAKLQIEAGMANDAAWKQQGLAVASH